MERDCLIAHGTSAFMKERLLDTSDIYTAYVCNHCGLLAAKYKDRDVWYCPACKKSQDPSRNPTNVSRVVTSYAFKLLMQELMAINILPRLKLKDE